jgi:GNAT superfamily N-acetyltransferase
MAALKRLFQCIGADRVPGSGGLRERSGLVADVTAEGHGARRDAGAQVNVRGTQVVTREPRVVTREPRVVIRELGLPGDLGWVVQAHGEVYAAEFGWDVSFEALVVRIVADYARGHDPAREAAWIAEVDGERAGCVFCVAGDEDTAKLRILLVHPGARGNGLGHRLVGGCMEFARGAGYSRMQLWTNDVLAAARRIYLQHGFTLTAQEPHHSFGVDLVGQTYEADLAASRSGASSGSAE